MLDRTPITTDITIEPPIGRATGLRRVLRRSKFWKRRSNRQAQTRFKARNKDKKNVRNCYRVELDGAGLTALQRWRGLTDAEIGNCRRVGEELSKVLAEAVRNDPKNIG